MTEEKAQAMLQKRMQMYKTQKEAALAFKVTPQHLNDVLAQRRAITGEIAKALGLEVRRMYFKIEEAK